MKRLLAITCIAIFVFFANSCGSHEDVSESQTATQICENRGSKVIDFDISDDYDELPAIVVCKDGYTDTFE